LDLAYEGSPVIVADGPSPLTTDDDDPLLEARPGARLPHVRIGDRSIYDDLGDGMTVLVLGNSPTEALERSARDHTVPLRVVRHAAGLRGRYGAELILVRPDQHVAWRADRLPADPTALLDRVRGANHSPTQGET
jgi:hypothetical protein